MDTKSLIELLVLGIIYFGYRFWLEPRIEIKRPRIATLIEVIIILLFLPLYQIVLQDYADRGKREEERIWRQKVLDATNEQGFELEQYRQRLVEVHKEAFKSTSEDAEAWAKDFLAKLNIKRDRKRQKEEKERIRKEKDLAKIPVLFEFILQDFDSKAMALKDEFPEIEFSKEGPYDFTVDPSEADNKQLLIRKLVFGNGHSMELMLGQGNRSENMVTTYPHILFTETTKNLKRAAISFRIHKPKVLGVSIVYAGSQPPLVSDMTYSLEEGGFMSDGFRRSVSGKFKEALEYVFMGDF